VINIYIFYIHTYIHTIVDRINHGIESQNHRMLGEANSGAGERGRGLCELANYGKSSNGMKSSNSYYLHKNEIFGFKFFPPSSSSLSPP